MNHISSVAQTPTLENSIEEAYLDENHASSSSNNIERLHHFSKASQKYKAGRENKTSGTENAYPIRSHKSRVVLPYNDAIGPNSLQELTIFSKNSDNQNTENLGKNLSDLKKRRKVKERLHGQLTQGSKKSHLKACSNCRKYTYHKGGFCTICKNQFQGKLDKCCILISAWCCCVMGIAG